MGHEATELFFDVASPPSFYPFLFCSLAVFDSHGTFFNSLAVEPGHPCLLLKCQIRRCFPTKPSSFCSSNSFLNQKSHNTVNLYQLNRLFTQSKHIAIAVLTEPYNFTRL